MPLPPTRQPGSAHYFRDFGEREENAPILNVNGNLGMGDDMRTVWYTANGVCTYDTEKLYSRVGYTGHVQDDDSGLVYAGARYLDPIIGRFLSIDPDPVEAGKPQTFNRYAYANNNPFSYTDPTGKGPVGQALSGLVAPLAGAAAGAAGSAAQSGRTIDGVDQLSGEQVAPGYGSEGPQLLGRPFLEGPEKVYVEWAVKNTISGALAIEKVKGLFIYADKTDNPKAKASSSDPGDIIRTPTTHPGDFSSLSKGDKSNVKTGEIWSPSDTNHSNSEGGEWKVGRKPGEEPRAGSKITVSDGGKIIKKDK